MNRSLVILFLIFSLLLAMPATSSALTIRGGFHAASPDISPVKGAALDGTGSDNSFSMGSTEGTLIMIGFALIILVSWIRFMRGFLRNRAEANRLSSVCRN